MAVIKNIWCMNLRDNRAEDSRNKDKGLKFRLCREKDILAVGWSVPEPVHTLSEYRKIADKRYNTPAYRKAMKALQDMQKGDLVWVRDPENGSYYLAEIKDGEIGIYDGIKEFDSCAYRHATYYAVSDTEREKFEALTPKKLSARHTIEKMHEEKRGATIRETEQLFYDIEKRKEKEK